MILDLLVEKLTRANSTLPTAGLPMVTTLTSAAGHCSADHTPHSVACTDSTTLSGTHAYGVHKLVSTPLMADSHSIEHVALLGTISVLSNTQYACQID